MIIKWFYHMDEDGREWGPFTPGQLTSLLNEDVLTKRSKVRPEGDAVWYSYYRCPKHQPGNSFDLELTEEDERKMQAGDKLARKLKIAVARKRA
jgi:hypothetical protein